MGQLLSRKERRARKQQAAVDVNERFAEKGIEGVHASVKGDKLVVTRLKVNAAKKDL
ncbi:MAG: hypothetical protein KAR39_13435 [Thermoplasmata archaeon]|nr:hypothetical protein [Thermoplasmata archaeon]